jgi:hypothetical protein
MRVLASSLVLACLVGGVALGQTRAPAAAVSVAPEGPPDLSVLKYSWTKERINWEGDPFGGPIENFDDVRRRRVDERRVERARSTGNLGEAAKVEREMRAEQVLKSRPPEPPRYAFLYKISVQNTGAKAIREIDWDYIFHDAATGEELDRREFTAIEKIAHGKRKELTFLISTPPTRRISAQALDKRERDGLSERVRITRVLYEDGTVWRNP